MSKSVNTHRIEKSNSNSAEDEYRKSSPRMKVELVLLRWKCCNVTAVNSATTRRVNAPADA